MDVSRHYRAGTASVASEYDGDAHAAFRYELADGAVDGAHDFCHYSAFYVVDDFFVDSEEGGREEGQLFDAHFGAGVEDHVDDVVSVSKVVVEGDGHAAFEAAGFDGFFDRADCFVGVVAVEAPEFGSRDVSFGLFREGSLVVFYFAVAFYVVGDFPFYCVDCHFSSPLVGPFMPGRRGRVCIPLF